ncbi:Maf family protein [Shimazuella alba]|uniref:dTTP/UTP pyrophosphatase n=1 Tax=Shimazuella alba TaxID=2690964 RepID=A0A6I4VWN1_9BACL|nr:Maf family protein [Shimazuella alba]MXQ55333.1 septum formation inhibitor Maf [Shimazuella alba]
MTHLILASSSPRRKELLEQLGLSFEVISSSVDESQIALTEPEQLVMELALLKARSVAATSFSSAVIIGADTVVSIDGKILGKPADRQHAVAMLQQLSGRKHQVFTGITLIECKAGEITQVITDFRQTNVWMTDLSDQTIAWYVDTGEPMDKAGSYGIQALGACLVDRIDGCYFNVVGLSLPLLHQMFGQLGYHLMTDFSR